MSRPDSPSLPDPLPATPGNDAKRPADSALAQSLGQIPAIGHPGRARMITTMGFAIIVVVAVFVHGPADRTHVAKPAHPVSFTDASKAQMPREWMNLAAVSSEPSLVAPASPAAPARGTDAASGSQAPPAGSSPSDHPAVPDWKGRKMAGGLGNVASGDVISAIGPASGPHRAPYAMDSVNAPAEAPGVEGQDGGSSLQRRLEPSSFATGHAMSAALSDVISQGTLIRCVLDTAIDSALPGLVACHGIDDVTSDDGRTVLLPRGTHYVGEQRGDMKQGERRLFIVWNRARTPTGLVVALASPGTDALGRSGVDGTVDERFGRRFGSAIALSLLSDVANVAGARRDGTTIVLGNSTRAGEQVVGKVLEDAGHIGPVLRKQQGELVQIMLARDLDFSAARQP